MRKFVAITTIAAATLGAPAAAFADTSVEGENCVVVSESAGVDGLGVTLDAQLCESHSASPDLVRIEAGGPIQVTPHVEPDRLVPEGEEPEGPTPEERLEGILEWIMSQVPEHGLPETEPGEGDGEGTSVSELYRQIVEGAGMEIYEDEVCPEYENGLEYTTDCWWDDYLLGSYVKDYLVSYVDGIVPLPDEFEDLVRGVIDEVLVVTNSEFTPPEFEEIELPDFGALSVPQPPFGAPGDSAFEVPPMPNPEFEIPEFDGGDLSLPGEGGEPGQSPDVEAILADSQAELEALVAELQGAIEDAIAEASAEADAAPGAAAAQVGATAAEVQALVNEAIAAAEAAAAEARAAMLAAPGQAVQIASDAGHQVRTIVHDTRLSTQQAIDAAIADARGSGEAQAVESALRTLRDGAERELALWADFVESELLDTANWVTSHVPQP